MNRWLDSQFKRYPDTFRNIQITAYSSFAGEKPRSIQERKRNKSFATAIFSERDLLHDHSGLACLVPQDVFRFTMLRKPVDRLISQLKDFRRLEPHQYAHHQPNIREIHSDIKKLPLTDYLEKHALKNGPFRHFFDNYLVRAVSQNRIGILSNDHHDAGAFLPTAIETLDKDFEFVGILEQKQMTWKLLSAFLGWAPPQDWPVLNKTDPDSSSQKEIEAAKDILAELTKYDETLYRHACRLFENTKEKMATQIGDEFPPDVASSRLRSLQAKYTESGMMYDMNQPITGAGHTGRHTDQEGHSWIWTDPTQPFTLFMPVPPNTDLTVFLRILAYGNDTIRDQMTVLIDGKPVTHKLEKGPDCKDFLVTTHHSVRSFLRLELLVNSGADVNIPGADGVRIDAYGWR